MATLLTPTPAAPLPSTATRHAHAADLDRARRRRAMRFAYADPPYPGMAHLYKDHPDYAGEVDHKALIERLVEEFPDGWALSSHSPALRWLLPLCPERTRTLVWVNLNAEPRTNPPIINYKWEPVLAFGGRRPLAGVSDVCIVPRLSGFFPTKITGAKPEGFSFWLFRCLGALPGDELVDLFPGSGAVGRAWDKYQRQMTLPMPREKVPQLAFTEEES